MANIFQNITDWFNRKAPLTGNMFNRAAYEFLGGQAASYDYDNKVYLDKGFGMNPDVYAIVMQRAKKLSSVPWVVNNISDLNSKRKLDQLQYATKGNLTIQQMARKKMLEVKAYTETELDFPLDEPNPIQTWTEIFSLYEVYMSITGNAYLYMVSPEEGMNKDVPKEVYILPSHFIKIVLKKDANLIEDESPISHYMLIEGNQYLEFPENKVIHIKYPNPFFDWQGSHLYGLSPIKSVLRNIESSNDAIDGNVKTMKNSGIFGFITSADKDNPFTADQAIQIKEKLQEMDRSTGRLSKIAGGSAPIQFTKLSLNTNELQPFEFLNYDQKTIANVLGWSVMLLNNTENTSYNNLNQERKRVITDTINPDLILLASALNKNFIPRFGKAYLKAEIEFDITELPEMQEDYEAMLKWMNMAPLTPNQILTALKYETSDLDGMDVPWFDSGKKRIDDIGISEDEITKAFRSE